MTSSGALARRRAFAFGACFSFALFLACAKGETGDIGDGGITPAEDSGMDTSLRYDTAPPDDDGGTTPGEDSSTGCTRKVVINELSPRVGAATAEFIELYNAGTCAVPLTGWTIPYRSSTGGGNADLYKFETGDSIPAKGFLVIATSELNVGDLEMNGGMADDGQIALLDEKKTTVDSVAWGSTTGPFVEGSPAPKAAANGSIARKSDGVDTNDNKADFEAKTQHTAGAAN